MATQDNKEVVALMNPNVGMAASQVCDFTSMNPPEFYGSKVDKDPQEFIEGIAKIMDIMGINLNDKADLIVYQIKGVSRVWYGNTRMKDVEMMVPLIEKNSRFNKDRVSNPKPQGGAPSGQPILPCKKYGKKHLRECLAGLGDCFGCGKTVHQVKDCPSSATRGGDGRLQTLTTTGKLAQHGTTLGNG
ncbi:uncharacterized protein LOC129872498 [Solanum dulcamara]|uniref:uncharacterized protein LOC129872498 n=1 Tax=Solanum dulcamara TaxID=45834 RepID=UPI002484E897|nr:uncharacterized protein LOC129872498 [Solanum dulcamara]